MRGRAAAIVGLAAVAMAAGAPAQQPRFRSGADVIVVDVNVVDGDGRPVAGLRPTDFVVSIDGKPRPVASLDFVTLSTPPSADSPVAPRRAAFSTNAIAAPRTSPTRTMLLVVDQAHISMGGRRAAATAAQGFVDALTPAARVGVVLLPTQRFGLEFTTDGAQLAQDVKRIVGQERLPALNSPMTTIEAYAFVDRQTALWNEFVSRTCRTRVAESGAFRGTASGESVADIAVTGALSECEHGLENDARLVVEESRRQTRATMASLRALVATLGQVEGPKTMAVLSEGLVVGRNPEDLHDFEQSLDELSAAAARSRVIIYVLQLDRTSDNYDLSRANVVLSSDVDSVIRTGALQAVAKATAGAFLTMRGDGKPAFRRVALETSSYYLIGLEPEASDRDGAAHRIDVGVARPGVTIRARKEFAFAPTPKTSSLPAAESTVATLLGPAAFANQIPIRVATYTVKDMASGNPRVFITADLDRGATSPKAVTIGYAVRDRRERLVGTSVEKGKLEPVAEPPGALGFVTNAVVLPGAYVLKLGLVDAAGRTGNVEHPFEASLTPAGPGIEMSDVMVVDPAEAAKGTWRPLVDPVARDGRVLLFVEVYGADPNRIRQARVRFEVARRDDDNRAAASTEVGTEPTSTGSRVTSQATLAVNLLPPGEYVARAVVVLNGKPAGRVVRPLRIERPVRPEVKAASRREKAVPTSTAGDLVAEAAVEPFRRETVLQPDFVGVFLDRLLKAPGVAAPALARAAADAKAGRFDQAADFARSLDPASLATCFLRGLALLAKNDLNAAADSFRAALRMSSEFFPAVVYLGACYAAGGRDRDAAGAWETSLLTESDVPQVYLLLADALLRLNDGEQARDMMIEATASWPDDTDLKRRLGAAYALLGQEKDALRALEPYLERHPEDHRALFLALGLIYSAHLEDRAIVDLERDRITFDAWAGRYASAGGPNQLIVAEWQRYLSKKMK